MHPRTVATRVLVALALVGLFIGAASQPRAEAETVGHMLGRECPNGAMIRDDEARLKEAGALGKPTTRLYEALAQLYYRCSQDGDTSYLRDFASLNYAENLAFSQDPTADWLRVTKIAILALNELAFRTKYEDVRAHALSVRRQLKNAYVKVYTLTFNEAPNDVRPETLPSRGSRLYATHCASCHALDGSGGVGPSLKTGRYTSDDLVQIIENPPHPMPSLYPSRLTDEEVRDIADYVTSKFGGS